MEQPNLPIAGEMDSDALAALRVYVPGYRLVGILGRGGQAAVYKAIDLKDGEPVAIKLLHGGPLADGAARARFEREILAVKALKHPNIVGHRASGQTPNGHDYLVMNFIEGERLDEYLWKREVGAPLDLQTRLRLFLKICRAVGEAHRAGITHRDLSPSNIRVDAAGEPHILDFGLARTAFDDLLTPSHGPVTATNFFVGKLFYASPEQVSGGRSPIDIRSDVYALGVMLYQILADGSFPYDVQGSMAEVLENILHTMPNLPVAMEGKPEQGPLQQRAGKVAIRALQKRPDGRHESANALALELEECLFRRRTAKPGQRLRKWLVAGMLLMVAVTIYFLRPGRSRISNPSAVTPAVRGLPNVASSEEDSDVTRPVFAQESAATQLSPPLVPPRPSALAAAFPLTTDDARKIQREYAAATSLPMLTTLNIGSARSMKFALIPPGHFLASSPEGSSGAQSQHRITISHPFYLATTPVTVAQFSTFVKQTNFRTVAVEVGAAFIFINDTWKLTPGASWHAPGFEQSPNDPVVEMSWFDAVEFCNWLSKSIGHKVRLPTSAEWEYACRSGTATAFYTGDTWAELEKAAWCLENSAGRTHPVGLKIPNAWGLYDMHGNAAQWCQDWYAGPPTADAVDPTGPVVGELRVNRGGAWVTGYMGARSGWFGRNYPNTIDAGEGFRVLLEVPPAATPP